MRCVSAGPRNVTAPGTAGRGCAPEAIRSASYSSVSNVVRACLRTASTPTSAPGVNVAPASSARRARSKCWASPSPNGSATDIGRYQNCGSGASSSTSSNSPANARSASAASSAATPPPAIRTLVASPRMAPPSVDDQDVTVGLPLDAAADAEPEQVGEDARLTGSDDDQVGVTYLGDTDDLVCRLAQPGDVLAVESVLGEDGGGMAKLLVVLLERVDRINGPEAVSRRHEGSRDTRHHELAAECRGQLDRTGECSLRGLAFVVSDHDGLHRWPSFRCCPHGRFGAAPDQPRKPLSAARLSTDSQEGRLQREHGRSSERARERDPPTRRDPDSGGNEVAGDDPRHRARREPQPGRQERLEPRDEEESRNSPHRLRQAREHAPGRRPADRDAARHEHAAEREPLRDVVDGDRQGDHQPELLASAERDADPDALGERVERHYAD